MIKIALMNQKGGTGKTTSVLNIAGELALRKKKVLIIDMDTQGNATANLKITVPSTKTLSDAIEDTEISLQDTICHTAVEGLDLIQGGAILGSAFNAIQKMLVGRDTVLKRLLAKLPQSYDFILLDCSPSLESVLNINVLVATDYVLIPIRVDKNSIEGYGVMLDTIQLVRETENVNLRALGVFMTAVEIGSSLDREMIKALPATIPTLAFHSYIRKNIDVKKAPIAQVPLCYYNARCTGARDYAALTNEILTRIADWR
ncbi:MAG: ParA family protein [Butyricicoccus pullicaecorum]|nr:ParA family protein [Butyricicoccus pullicaecorum]